MLHAAQANNIQVIWDLCHYGWPDHLDIWQPAFVEHFARFAGAVAAKVRDEGIRQPCYTPINSILFWRGPAVIWRTSSRWASNKGKALKQQLVRGTLAAMDAIRAVDGTARFVQPEPVVHINAPADQPEQEGAAEELRMAQFDVWDMLSGRICPELGGAPGCLDIVGVGYRRPINGFSGGRSLPLTTSTIAPFAAILQEIHQRYQRPILIAETGAGERHAGALDALCVRADRAGDENKHRRRGIVSLSGGGLPQLERG